MVGHRRVWPFLRALLHRPGRAAAVAYQRASFLVTPQVSLPNFADPYNGANPFNGSFSQPMTLLTLDKDLSLPYAQDWNLNVERSFGTNWLFEAGYVGTKGTKLPRFIEGNPTTFDGATQNNSTSAGFFPAAPLLNRSRAIFHRWA